MKWSEADKRRWLIEQGYEESLENYELTQDPATSMDEAKRERSENWRLNNKVIYGLMHEVLRVKLFESMPDYFNRIVKLCNTPEEFEKMHAREYKRRLQLEMEKTRQYESKGLEDTNLTFKERIKDAAETSGIGFFFFTSPIWISFFLIILPVLILGKACGW